MEIENLPNSVEVVESDLNQNKEYWVSRSKITAGSDLLEKYGKVLGSFLWSRNLRTELSIEDFFKTDLKSLKSPFVFLNMKESAERVADSLELREKIAVYSDYDMDGMSGLAILHGFLQEIASYKIDHYQPARLEEGYGVHASAIEALAQRGIQTVITVDTGITGFEAAVKAKEKRITLIITDHHKQVSDELPDTPFIVNPNQRSDQSGLSYISGAGMAFYFCMALRAVLRTRNYFEKNEITEPMLTRWLDFFVLGTVADVVELRGDNRTLVKWGLEKLNTTQHPGLRALIEGLKANSSYFGVPKINSRDVAFALAPKLNAASRLGRVDVATELLLCRDPERAKILVDEIFALNKQRVEIQDSIVNEALVQAERQIQDFNPGVLICHGPWHEGVLGIIAAKISEKYFRAAIVLSLNSEHKIFRGSMRSPKPLSCVRLLESAKNFLVKFGGHQAAAGLSLEESHLPNFCREIWSQSKTFLTDNPFCREVLFDGEIFLNQHLSVEEIDKLENLCAPFGQGNEEPLFLVKKIPLNSIQVLKEKHIRCQFSGTGLSGVSGIGFNLALQVNQLLIKGHKFFDALVTPELNRFRDRINVQLKIKNVRPFEIVDTFTRS